MIKLWQWLYKYYGSKCELKYGDIDGDVFGDWSDDLESYGLDDIKRGMLACRERQDVWPPDLMEFLRLCKEPKDNSNCRGYNKFKRIPVFRSEPGVAKSYLDKLKKIVRR